MTFNSSNTKVAIGRSKTGCNPTLVVNKPQSLIFWKQDKSQLQPIQPRACVPPNWVAPSFASCTSVQELRPACKLSVQHQHTCSDDCNELGAKMSLWRQLAWVGVFILEVCCHYALLCTQKMWILKQETHQYCCSLIHNTVVVLSKILCSSIQHYALLCTQKIWILKQATHQYCCSFIQNTV